MKKSICLLLLGLTFVIFAEAQSNTCDNYQIKIDSLLNGDRHRNIEIAEQLFATTKICLFVNGETSKLEKLKPFSVVSTIEKGYAVARKFNQYVIIDKNFDVLTKLNYYRVFPFENGYAKAINYDGSVGLIDVKGKVIIPMLYTKIEKIKDGYIANDNKSITIFDDNFKVIWKTDSYNAFEVKAPTVIELVFNSSSILIDNKGKNFFNETSEFSIYPTKNQGVFVSKMNKYYFLSSLTPTIYEFDKVNLNINLKSNLKTEDFSIVQKGSEQFLFNTKTFSLIPWNHQTPVAILNENIIVQKDGKFGLIDVDNNIILPIEYDYCCLPTFKNKHLVFKKGDNNFFLDLTTNSIAEFKYNIWDIVNKESSLYLVKQKKYGIIDSEQNEIFPIIYDTLSNEEGFNVLVKKSSNANENVKLYYSRELDILIENSNNLYRVFNQKGQKINEFIADKIQLKRGEGVSILQGANQGYLSLDGNILIPPKYDKVIGNNLTKLQEIKIKENQGLFWNGSTQILPIEYSQFQMFGGGFFVVKKGPLFGLTDIYGETILSPEYTKIQSPTVHNYLRLIVKKDNLVGLFDLESKQFILPLEYDNISILDNNSFSVIKGGKMGFLDAQLKVILPMVYDELVFNRSTISFSKDKKMGLLTMQGKLLTTEDFDQISFFRDGLAVVYKNKKVGLINEKGAIVVPLKYDYVGFVGESRCAIKVNDRYGLIDYSGKVIVQPIYDNCKSFEDGIIRFESDSEFIFIDPSGKIVEKTPNSSPVNTFGGN